MNSSKKSFLLHIDSLDILDELTDEEAGALFKAIRSYQKCEELNLTGLVRVAFSPFRNQFIRDNEKYDLTCKRRAEAGSKGGKAKQANASKSKQDLANVADSKSKNKSKTNSDSGSDLKPMSAKANPAFDLFKYWCDVMGKNLSTSKLTAKRDKAIKARLKEGYTVEQIKQAIDGCRNDPFSMGQNDRQKPFNDIELICRTGEKLESFMETIGNEKIINGQSTTGRKLSAVERQQLRLQEKYGSEPGQPSGGLGMAEDGRDLRGAVDQGEWRGTVIDVEDSPE